MSDVKNEPNRETAEIAKDEQEKRSSRQLPSLEQDHQLEDRIEEANIKLSENHSSTTTEDK